MIRLMLGAAIAAVAMVVLGILLTQTPLAGLGAGKVNMDQAAAVQAALRANLVETGTYRVPDPNTAAQTGQYAQGPIATIAFTAEGGATGATGPMRYIVALFLDFLVALAIGAAMRKAAPGGGFAGRARVAVQFGIAAAAFIHLSAPIWLLSDWSSAVFGMIADGVILGLAGCVVAWFAPREVLATVAETGQARPHFKD